MCQFKVNCFNSLRNESDKFRSLVRKKKQTDRLKYFGNDCLNLDAVLLLWSGSNDTASDSCYLATDVCL